MYINDINFQVEFSHYAETHFCKDFLKKYKIKKWLSTKQSIKDYLERAFGFQQTNLIDVIKYSSDEKCGIFKLDFRVAGTQDSPKTSGNRVVFVLNNNIGKIEVLLVYGKDHCAKKQSETQWLLEQVKQNFPQYKKFC